MFNMNFVVKTLEINPSVLNGAHAKYLTMKKPLKNWYESGHVSVYREGPSNLFEWGVKSTVNWTSVCVRVCQCVSVCVCVEERGGDRGWRRR